MPCPPSSPGADAWPNAGALEGAPNAELEAAPNPKAGVLLAAPNPPAAAKESWEARMGRRRRQYAAGGASN